MLYYRGGEHKEKGVQIDGEDDYAALECQTIQKKAHSVDSRHCTKGTLRHTLTFINLFASQIVSKTVSRPRIVD